MRMARHGATPNGGVNRQALSLEDAAAWRELIGWGRGLALDAATDAAGNLFLRWVGSDPDAAPVMTGSHIDSQPTGGKFDGIYGVLAALEAVQAMRDAGLAPRRSIEIVAWMNEEGSRFAPGMMGSAVFAGARSLDEILNVSDREGVTVEQALGELHAAFADLPVLPLRRPVHAYMEAHIEQGPLLEREQCTIGVVTGIQGKRTFLVSVAGEEAHAGTTPHRDRKDALLAAVALIHQLAQICGDPEDLVRFTVGMLDVKPNAPSVVPSHASFSIDLRHPDSAVLRSLGDKLVRACENAGGACTVQVREMSTAASLDFPPDMRELIRRHAREQGIPCMDILSSAGHDARYLHTVCPAGMIFVPCKGGISHNEAESATPQDLADGARVLVETLVDLAGCG
jgi:N-carbamoyl-L-amino-acid hydrolase